MSVVAEASIVAEAWIVAEASIESITDLPFDALLEVILSAAEPPCTPSVGAIASTCRAFAAAVRSAEFWRRMASRTPLPYPPPSEATADGYPQPHAAFVAGWRKARAAWNEARLCAGEPDERQWDWAEFHALCRGLRAGWRRADEPAPPDAQRACELAELACWACQTCCPVALVATIVVLELEGSELSPPGGGAGGLWQLLFAACATPEARRLLETARVRVLWWSLGGKDLRGYRCRDEMHSADLSLAELTRPRARPNARKALQVLLRGEVYEVHRVAVEVYVAAPQAAAQAAAE